MVTAAELNAFFREEFPQAPIVVEEVGELSATIRQKISAANLRPGGTVSGPTMMGLADAALYAAILGQIGLVALAVTTNLNINFLRKPDASKDLIAQCKLIKLGKLLAIGEVTIYSEGVSAPVAHATGTYAIPPK